MLIVCIVKSYDGEYMTCQDYNDEEAVYSSVFMGGQSVGNVKSQFYPQINDLVLIGIDDEGRAHFIKALYNDDNGRPFSALTKLGFKNENTEISYDPGEKLLKILVDGKIEIGNGTEELFNILVATIDTLISGKVLTADGPAPFTADTIASLQNHKADLEKIGG